MSTAEKDEIMNEIQDENPQEKTEKVEPKKDEEEGKSEVSQSDGDFEYVDDEFLEEMDKDKESDGESDDFRTMKESEIGDEE